MYLKMSLRVSVLRAAFLTVAFVSCNTARAQQHDAEFYQLQKAFGTKWKADDKQVQSKLAELEKRFGKKPNIIKILVDDVGYTELGCYGGGKLRGAPTPNLDKLARQGMRFLSFLPKHLGVTGVPRCLKALSSRSLR